MVCDQHAHSRNRCGQICDMRRFHRYPVPCGQLSSHPLCISALSGTSEDEHISIVIVYQACAYGSEPLDGPPSPASSGTWMNPNQQVARDYSMPCEQFVHLLHSRSIDGQSRLCFKWPHSERLERPEILMGRVREGWFGAAQPAGNSLERPGKRITCRVTAGHRSDVRAQQSKDKAVFLAAR